MDKSILPIFILIICIIFLISLPFINIWTVTDSGKNWQGIVPEYTNDTNYYLARMHEIADGYLFAGNPYYQEYASEPAPAFFVADWIAATPMLLGLSVQSTIAVNFVFWSLILALLMYAIFLKLSVKPWYAMFGSLFIFYLISTWMIRPVIMQIIFPFFAFFILTYIVWLQKPQSKIISVFFVLSLASSFIYTFFTQIVIATIILTFLYFLITKNYTTTKQLVYICIATLVLSSPFIYYMFIQTTHPYYWESMHRIGLVETHLPTGPAFRYGIWLGIMLMSWLAFYRFTKTNHSKLYKGKLFLFIPIVLFALLSISFSNIITGKEFETATHVQRFNVLFLAISLIVLLYHTLRTRKIFSFNQLIILLIMLGIGTIGLIKNYTPSFLVGSQHSGHIKESQIYAGPLKWLENKEDNPIVVWVEPNSPLINYIPVYTKHYVLYSPLGVLQLISNEELEKRYLIAHYFTDVNVESLQEDYRSYGGVGSAFNLYQARNRGIMLCKLLSKIKLDSNCGTYWVNGAEFKGRDYFESLEQLFDEDIKNNIHNHLYELNVAYIVDDKQFPSEPDATLLESYIEAYQDKRFILYARVY